MLSPLKEFICDTCAEVINEPQQGVVQWNITGNKYQDFKIIHDINYSPLINIQNGCCQHKGLSNKLSDFLGYNGQIKLVNLLDNRKGFICDQQHWVELFRRTQIRYYEEARKLIHGSDRIAINGLKADTFLTPDNLLKIINKQYNTFEYYN